jgi:ABC-type lipoprotein release transport system permease subunit
MGAYLEQYGQGEERRNRIIKWIIIGAIAIAIAMWIVYLLVHNRAEIDKAKRFLAEVNAHQYKQAYVLWGCTPASPCPNYDYSRFLEDWGPQSKVTAPWKVVSTDACKTFLTVNVDATGAQMQSIAVERGSNHEMSFAPAPQCMEKKWRWKEFFHRIFGGGTPSVSQ